MAEQQYTDWKQVWLDLGGKPPAEEVARLKQYYPTYEFPHRLPLLEGLLWGSSDIDTMLAKLASEGTRCIIAKQEVARWSPKMG